VTALQLIFCTQVMGTTKNVCVISFVLVVKCQSLLKELTNTTTTTIRRPKQEQAQGEE